MTIDGNTRTKSVGKRDQFAPELLYFSDCILKDTQPEPSGEEDCRTCASSKLVRVGATATAGQDTALSETCPADIAPTDLTTRREEATPGQSAKRESD